MNDDRREHFEHLRSIVSAVKTGMLVTHDADIGLRARPLQTRGFDDDGTLWFIVARDAAMIDELRDGDGQLCLTYADEHGQRYASITGSGRIETDRKRLGELWRHEDDMWFPQGVDDPDIVLLRIAAQRAEFWDRPADPVTRSWGTVRALFFGETDVMRGTQAKLRVDAAARSH